MNSDGTSVSKFDLPDMGYVIDPAWSPNGQILAFSWRRPNGNYDIYVMEAATSKIIEITRDAGPQRASQLGSRWPPHRLRIHSRRHAPNLEHARRRLPAPSTNHHRPQRIPQLVPQIMTNDGIGRTRTRRVPHPQFFGGWACNVEQENSKPRSAFQILT